MASRSSSSRSSSAVAAVGCVGAALLEWSTAQAQSPPSDLTALKTPDSPAFVALELSPSEVQRPTTPKAFAAALASKFKGSDGAIPQGLAIEVAPYWLAPHPDLSFYELSNAGVESLFYQDLTISVASASEPETPDAGTATVPAATTNAAIGVRTSIVRPPLDGEQRRCVESIHNALNGAAKGLDEIVKAELEARLGEWWQQTHRGPLPTKPGVAPQPPAVVEPPSLALLPAPDKDDPEYEAKMQAHDAALVAATKQLTDYFAFQAARERYEEKKAAFEQNRANFNEFREKKKELTPVVQEQVYANERKDRLATLNQQLEPCMKVINARGDGVSLDVAGAAAFAFPDSVLRSGELSRALGWASLAYSANTVSFVGLGRVLHDRSESTDAKTGYDLGLRLVFAVDRWGLSVEGVRRRLGDDPSEQRYTGGFDYRLTDGTWLNMTFGKDYGAGNDGGVIALANLQVNLGDQRLQPLPEPAH